MKAVTFILILVSGFLGEAAAQVLQMNDGCRINGKSVRRQGDNIMVQSPSVDGAQPVQGEVGYPLAQVSRIEFPEPPILRSGPEAIAQGRAEAVLGSVEQALNYFGGFRDAPGSYWADLAGIKLAALMALGRDGEAEPLARQLARMAGDPETARAAEAHLSGIAGRRGDHERAVSIASRVLRTSARPETLATAAMNQGRSHLELKQWDAALLSFLQIPVFYPEQRMHVPGYLLGAGKAYFGMDDLQRARETLNQLLKDHEKAPEATAAREVIERITRREQALAGIE
jgi:tetratricopeptide (TPR) repeat protein